MIKWKPANTRNSLKLTFTSQSTLKTLARAEKKQGPIAQGKEILLFASGNRSSVAQWQSEISLSSLVRLKYRCQLD